MKRGMTFHAERTRFGRRIDLFAIDSMLGAGDKMGVALPVMFESRDAMSTVDEPMLSMDITAAQVLMDSLWACGLRPTEGSGSAGALAATERHLADLQEIVRVTLNAALPGADE